VHEPPASCQTAADLIDGLPGLDRKFLCDLVIVKPWHSGQQVDDAF
jgi:hypothetical protein